MGDETRRNLTQPIDGHARKLARHLLRQARFAGLGVLRPNDGCPSVSRVLCATDFRGKPVLLISGLSLHANALGSDPRCSLLVGEPGKGDPLAHPRLTVYARAHILDPACEDRERLRARFLARHPKAELYVDFPDFRFAVLEPFAAALNGGFAKAYDLSPDDLIDPEQSGLEEASNRAVAHMNADHRDAIDEIAVRNGEEGVGWRISTADGKGFEIVRGDRLKRVEFLSDPSAEGGYRNAFVELLKT